MTPRTHRSSRRRGAAFRILPTAFALAGLALALPAAAQDTSGDPAGRVNASSVMVKLEAWTLGFQEAEVEAGEIAFRVENVGDNPHSLAIKGPNTEFRVEELILPHTARTFAIDLEPGTYRLYCPLEDHAEKGMEATLNVTQ